MRLESVMKRSILSSLVFGPALLLAALLVPAGAAAAGPITSPACSAVGTVVTCNLWAKTGTATVAGTTQTIWGFAGAPADPATIPGPVLVVNQGDAVTVNLTNTLTHTTSITFDGIAMVPDLAGVVAGGTKAYTFTASTPGTYLYEAGLLPGTQYQASLGLTGALIVRPTGLPGQAYADVSTTFGDEALVIASEIDPALNASATPWTFDLRNFAPRYFLVNGAAYTSASSDIAVTSGNTLLLRYINAGIQHHSLAVLGLHQRVLAADGSLLPSPRTMVAETLAPGQTADVLVTLPPTTATSTRYPIYDGALVLNNSTGSAIGGMLAFINASGTASGTDTVGPITSGVALALPSGALTASISDLAAGASGVSAAEYFIDSVGANGTGTAITTGIGPDPASVSATVGLGPLSSGAHTVFVHGQDSLGNWGTPSSASFYLDKIGPATSALTLTPNPSNGLVSVTLGGTASNVATGNGNVTAAEYFIGAPGADGTGTTVNRNTTSPVVSLSATITAGPGGVVSVHAQDAAGNWGVFATINLTVDAVGPVTSGVTSTPSSTNGTTGQSSTNLSVRISASFSDATTGGSNVAGAEGFIDSAGANGTGFPFLATDGLWNAVTEAGYAEIPLPTLNLLPVGNRTVYVHSKDAVGSWGATSSVLILIDRTAPTFTGITLAPAAPNPTLGANVTLIIVGASDPLVAGLASGVSGGEYWIDTAAPAVGSGTAFTGLTASIPTTGLTTGTHTISARIRDAAGNWSTVTFSATVNVVPDAIFANGFETGGRPWGWTSASTNTTTRLNVTAGSAQVGSLGLQAQGNNTNYVQYNFGTAAQPVTPTYNARFYFRPNGNTSAGKDILVAATSSTFGTNVFHVRYRALTAATPQVQIQVGATANATWASLLGGTSNNVIEVVWQSGTSLQLYVNGALSQTIATAATGSVGAVRLGSVTNTGASTLMYFDAFASKRSVSPLWGP